MKLFVAVACLLFSFVNYAQTGNVGIGTTNPQAQLHTSGSIRFDTLAGAGRRLMYADASGNITTSLPSYISETLVNIPDNSCDGIESAITVTGQPTAVSSFAIRVRINVNHPQLAQLSIQLIAPGGNKLVLTQNGSGVSYSNTIFWDGASQNILQGTTPYTGTYKPEAGGLNRPPGCVAEPSPGNVQNFSQIGGGSIVPNGVWRLRLFDKTANLVGQLQNWSISFDGSDPGSDRIELPDNIHIESINTSQTGAANMLAAAYGVVYSNATTVVSASSNNSTLTHPATGTYVVSFTSANLSGFNIGALPVSVTLYGGAPGYITYFGENGKITVNTFNSSWQPADRGFSFVVYKP